MVNVMNEYASSYPDYIDEGSVCIPTWRVWSLESNKTDNEDNDNKLEFQVERLQDVNDDSKPESRIFKHHLLISKERESRKIS